MSVERFIPAKTRLSVRDSAGKSQWYTTSKEIPITGEMTTVLYPMGTSRNVKTIKYQGFEVFFGEEQIRTRITADGEQAARSLQLHYLQYDIPTGTEVVHPSTYLPSYAIRTSLSCWVIPEGRIPYRRLNDLTEAGAMWHVTRIDPSEATKMLDMAVLALQKEMDAATERAEQTRREAEARLEATPTDEDPDKAKKRFLTVAKGLQKRNEELFKNMESAVQVFGLENRMINFVKARAAIASTATAMQTRARLYSEAVETLKARQDTDSKAVAAAVEAQAMPADILADYLQDKAETPEEFAQAEALRDSFKDVKEPTPEPVKEEAPVVETETFSLVGVGEEIE